MSTKHTPGPWTKSPNGGHVFGASGANVAITKHRDTTVGMAFPEDQDELHANARLIAAAPELLAALRDLVQAIESESASTQPLANAKEAIAQAEQR